MGVFDGLGDNQKQLLMIGVPVVAVFALVSVLGKRNQTASTASTVAPSTDVLGTGQLMDFESSVTAALAGVQNQVSSLPAQVAAAIPVPQQVSPAPAPSLPPIDHADFPTVAPPGTALIPLGVVRNGAFNGQNTVGGVPIYAEINGQFVQDFNWQSLAPGTQIETLAQFSDYVLPGTVSSAL